jgi:hypothetical protein
VGSVLFLLSFSGSCLVSSSLTEVWQFKFAWYLQVQEIRSVVHQLSCFGGGFLQCLFTGGLFLCLTPFLWGKVSDVSASPLLSGCCDGSLFVFQFCRAIWLWVLHTGSGDELCSQLPAYFRQWLITHLLLAFLPFQTFVYWYFTWRLVPCPSSILQCTFSISTPSAVY